LGIFPPGFVAEVVAFAFGLAAASFFPVIVLGIFWKRTTSQGAIAGMATGLIFTATYIILTAPKMLGNDPFIFNISAQGIGTFGMILNFIVTYFVSKATPEPPQDIQDMVASLRVPEVAEPYLEAANVR